MAKIKPPSAIHDLQRLRQSPLPINTSLGPFFNGAFFGRDSIKVGFHLLDTEPELVEEIICLLASLQGQETNSLSEEEKGRIFHESRKAEWADEKGLEILRTLSQMWGGSETELLYYGACDTTPDFVRLVGAYCQKYNSLLLDKNIIDNQGNTTTIRASVALAANWVMEHLDSSEIGLLEFQRSNPQGLELQSWKDSRSAYLYHDGSRLNFSSPVAVLGVQGSAYDSLLAALHTLPTHPNAFRWLATANELSRNIWGYFWLGDFFAGAIDRNADGNPRRSEIKVSDAGPFLASGLLSTLSDKEINYFVEKVATVLMSEEFLTDVGIRCRSVKNANLTTEPDYHGSWAVWVKETYDTAVAFHERGLPHLALALENRILHGAAQAGCHRELFWVSPEGQVLYNPDQEPDDKIPGIYSRKPEPTQAWSVSSVLAIKRRRGENSPLPPMTDFEEKILAAIPNIEAPQQTLEDVSSPFYLLEERT